MLPAPAPWRAREGHRAAGPWRPVTNDMLRRADAQVDVYFAGQAAAVERARRAREAADRAREADPSVAEAARSIVGG